MKEVPDSSETSGSSVLVSWPRLFILSASSMLMETFHMDVQFVFVWIISRVFLPFVCIFLFYFTPLRSLFLFCHRTWLITSISQWNRRILATLTVLSIGQEILILVATVSTQQHNGASLVSEKLIPDRQSAAAARTALFHFNKNQTTWIYKNPEQCLLSKYKKGQFHILTGWLVPLTSVRLLKNQACTVGMVHCWWTI